MKLPEELVEAVARAWLRMFSPEATESQIETALPTVMADEKNFRGRIVVALEAALPLVAKQMMEQNEKLAEAARNWSKKATGRAVHPDLADGVFQAMLRAHFAETYNLTLDGED